MYVFPRYTINFVVNYTVVGIYQREPTCYEDEDNISIYLPQNVEEGKISPLQNLQSVRI